MPDTTVRELLVEVEVAATAVMEWRPQQAMAAAAAGGPAWRSATPGVDFAILRLDHKMRGNTIPLPRALLK